MFVGHIGGDDFVVLMTGSVDFDKVCQDIIAEFDLKVQNYFNEEDLKKGYLEVPNRKGVIEEFPLTALSIGVVVAEKDRFSQSGYERWCASVLCQRWQYQNRLYVFGRFVDRSRR